MPISRITTFTGVNVINDPHNNEKGLFAPQLTSAQRDVISIPNSARRGCIIYNTTNNRFEVFNEQGWVALGSSAGGGDV